MKKGKFIPAMAAVLLLASVLAAKGPVRFYPQFGVDSYLGPNKLISISPWAGIRMGLSGSLSYILKYRQQFISFVYENEEGIRSTRQSSISNITQVLYFQKKRTDLYGALSVLYGKDRYNAVSLDAGGEYRLFDFLVVESGIYLLSESSTLWYPDEERRFIYLASVKAGLRIKITSKFSFNPQAVFYRNSDKVSARTLSANFIFNPSDPLYINVQYYKYKESAAYRFSGDYLAVGLNYYF